jgi:hypothetical protein
VGTDGVKHHIHNGVVRWLKLGTVIKPALKEGKVVIQHQQILAGTVINYPLTRVADAVHWALQYLCPAA